MAGTQAQLIHPLQPYKWYCPPSLLLHAAHPRSLILPDTAQPSSTMWPDLKMTCPHQSSTLHGKTVANMHIQSLLAPLARVTLPFRKASYSLQWAGLLPTAPPQGLSLGPPQCPYPSQGHKCNNRAVLTVTSLQYCALFTEALQGLSLQQEAHDMNHIGMNSQHTDHQWQAGPILSKAPHPPACQMTGASGLLCSRISHFSDQQQYKAALTLTMTSATH